MRTKKLAAIELPSTNGAQHLLDSWLATWPEARRWLDVDYATIERRIYVRMFPVVRLDAPVDKLIFPTGKLGV